MAVWSQLIKGISSISAAVLMLTRNCHLTSLKLGTFTLAVVVATSSFYKANALHLLFCYTDKFINRYMIEGILCNSLEATFRLQSWLQYLSITHVHTHARVVVMHKTQHQLNCSFTL